MWWILIFMSIKTIVISTLSHSTVLCDVYTVDTTNNSVEYLLACFLIFICLLSYGIHAFSICSVCTHNISVEMSVQCHLARAFALWHFVLSFFFVCVCSYCSFFYNLLCKSHLYSGIHAAFVSRNLLVSLA